MKNLDLFKKIKSKKIKKICVVGGSGFVGTALVNRLSKEQHQVKVFTRRLEKAKHLSMLPGVKIKCIDYYAPKVFERQLDGYDIVINLAGILNPKGVSTFKRVHVTLAQRLLEATSAVGIKRFIHMSALNAGNNASEYLMTKGQGQQVIHNVPNVNVTSFCPSIIYGQDDLFFNRFSNLLKLPGMLPLIGAKAEFAPIYVEDVVTAIINSLDNPQTYSNNYSLCGPKRYSLYELVQYTSRLSDITKTILPVNWFFSSFTTRIFSLFPIKPITVDNLKSMKVPSYTENGISEDLGVTPVSLESVLPWYLGKYEKNRIKDKFRDLAQS